MKKFLEFSGNRSILGRKSLFLIIISLLFFSCSNIENPIDLQPANQQVQEAVQDEDVSTGDLTSGNDDKTSTDEVGLSGYIPDVLPEVETEISSFSLTATEIALSTQSIEELLANPKVYLLENNDKPEDWYYYNAMKNDKDNPNRAKIYEAYLKLILAGAAIKGDGYPHKIEIPDYSYSYMSEDDLDKANWAFRYDHPEFFYVFWKYSDKRYWQPGDNIVYEGGSGG